MSDDGDAFYNDTEPFVCDWIENRIALGEFPKGRVDRRSILDVQAEDLVGFTQLHFFCGLGGWPAALNQAGWPQYAPVVTASLPCQPFSAAGKGLGVKDERHLWPHFFTLMSSLKPPLLFGEQVASAAGREWMGHVCADLESIGYSFACVDMPASVVGAPHIRQRLFWTASLQNMQKPTLRNIPKQGSLWPD